MSVEKDSHQSLDRYRHDGHSRGDEAPSGELGEIVPGQDASGMMVAHGPPHGTARPLREATILKMQRSLGNAHVQRMLRQPGMRAIHREPANHSTGTSLAQNPAPVRSGEQRYNLRVGTETIENVTLTEAIGALRRLYNHIHIQLEGDFEGHRHLRSVREDQWIVGFFADKLGGVEMPPLGIWSEPRSLLNAARSTLDMGSVEASIRNLEQAEAAYLRCHRRLVEYRDGTISGAETSVTLLHATAVVGGVAASVATGGVAAGAGLGLAGTSTAVGLVGGAYGATQELAGQAGAIGAGMRREGDFDVGAIIRRGATDAVTNFVGTLAGGALARQATRVFGSYLTNVTDDVLIELGEHMGLRGPLPRDFFLTQGQRFIADFLGGAGSSPLTTAVGAVVNRLTGGGPMPNSDQFVEMVVEDMVRGGAIQLFLGAFMHASSAGRSVPKTEQVRSVSGTESSLDTPTTSSRDGGAGASARATSEVVAATPRLGVWTLEETSRMMQVENGIEGFAGGEGVSRRTKGTTFLVRIGKAGLGQGGGKWGDHLFSGIDEAKAYAEWVFKNHPEEVARASRAVPHQWKSGDISDFEALKICEVPPDTAFLQGPIARQAEGAKGRGATTLPGGGMQVLIDPQVRVNPIDWELPIQPGGDASQVKGVFKDE